MRLPSSANVAMRDRRVFMRCDLNVPLDAAGGIADDTRIRASLPGIRDVLARGGRLMVASHLGRPAEGPLQPGDSLAPVARRLGELLGSEVPLAEGWLDEPPAVLPGRAVLLENCRANPGEKANSPELAARMARLCDIYVNDAFGTAHRAEATTEGLARIAPVACAGPLMLAEVAALARALATPRRPTAAIVGGAKVSTKLTILRSLAQQVDVLVVGGGMANTFLLAAGLRVGRSLCEPSLVEAAAEVANVLTRRGGRLVLPEDVVVATEVSAGAHARVRAVGEIAPDELVLDFGPVSVRRVADALRGCRTIVWNGPLGVFELEPFAAGTRALAHIVAASDAFTLAGGGDTVAAINRFCSVDDLDYVSTAGGAFLEFLEGRPLPALRALADRATP